MCHKEGKRQELMPSEEEMVDWKLRKRNMIQVESQGRSQILSTSGQRVGTSGSNLFTHRRIHDCSATFPKPHGCCALEIRFGSIHHIFSPSMRSQASKSGPPCPPPTLPCPCHWFWKLIRRWRDLNDMLKVPEFILLWAYWRQMRDQIYSQQMLPPDNGQWKMEK